MELVSRKGGQVHVHNGADRYPRAAEGWVQTPTGYLYPALLFYLENKYLNPREVYGLRISSSLLNKATWNSLQCENVSRIEVMLDGSGNAPEFNEILTDRTKNFPNWDNHYVRPLVFLANQLRAGDIEFLNGMRWVGIGRDMPAIGIDMNSRFEPRLLEGLEIGFELLVSELPDDKPFVKRLVQVDKMKRVSLYRNRPLTDFLQALEKRLTPLESLKIYECNFDPESWQIVCESINCRSLRLSQIYYLGKPMTPAILEKLGKNQSLNELIVYLEESQVPAIPSLMKIEGLERFEVHCYANCDAEITSAVQSTTLKNVWIDMQEAPGYIAEPEPWMDSLQSLRIDKKQLVRLPKAN